MDGQKVVAVKDIGLDYNVWDFVTKGLSVDNIRLDKPVIYLRRQGDTWTLSRLIKKQESEANRRGPERPITIQDIGISDGSLVIDDPVGTSGVDLPSRIDHRRCEAGVQVRAGALLDRHHARLVSRIGAGDRVERALRRYRRPRRRRVRGEPGHQNG
jgi:uncharacterized protein involved in outer membrane biogenesis